MTAPPEDILNAGGSWQVLPLPANPSASRAGHSVRKIGFTRNRGVTSVVSRSSDSSTVLTTMSSNMRETVRDQPQSNRLAPKRRATRRTTASAHESTGSFCAQNGPNSKCLLPQ